MSDQDDEDDESTAASCQPDDAITGTVQAVTGPERWWLAHQIMVWLVGGVVVEEGLFEEGLSSVP